MKVIESPQLPKEIFQLEVEPNLLAQAVRVFLANQRQGTQNAKTRAEINRTRKKLYAQKGTGGARHGDRKAPIFVGGGIAFAPKPRDYSLSLPGKMKKKALYMALTSKAKSKEVIVVSGMDKMTGKTSELAKFLSGLEDKIENLLIITDKIRENVYRSGNNIPGVVISPANQVTPYAVLNAKRVILMEEALDSFSLPKKETAPKTNKATPKAVPQIKKVVVKTTKPKAKKVSKK